MNGVSVKSDEVTPDIVTDIPLVFGRGIFGVVHRPSGPGRAGWVLCSPFGKEKTNSQRLFFEWGRCLATAGFWVIRFDYRGTGDSAGSFAEFTVLDYLEDIGTALEELKRVSGLQCRGVMGLRLGGGLAAEFLATSGQELDLVMWEPVLDGRRYGDSLLRIAMANQLVHKGGLHKSRDDFRRELSSGGSVSVDGFPLTAAMFDSFDIIRLSERGRPAPNPILVVHIRPGRERPPKPAVAQLVESYKTEGKACLVSAQAPPVWMRTRSYQWYLKDVFDKTLHWIQTATDPPKPANDQPPAAPGSVFEKSACERPVGFDVDGQRVWGVLHTPTSQRPNAPNIVLIVAGEACRSAFFYPHLARKLAERGWTVLRFDPRGIGDSEGDLMCERLVEVYYQVEDGVLVRDTLAAIDFLEKETGSSACILAGLCGGAITAILTAEEDDRVVGIAPLELPMTLTAGRGQPKRSGLSNHVPWDEALSQRGSTLFLLTARRFIRASRNRLKQALNSLSTILPSRSSLKPGDAGWYQEKVGQNVSIRVLSALERTLDQPIPVCCLFGDSDEYRRFKLVAPGLLAGRPKSEHCLAFRGIEGSDHNFMMPGCAEDLTEALVDWLESGRRPWIRTP